MSLLKLGSWNELVRVGRIDQIKLQPMFVSQWYHFPFLLWLHLIDLSM